MEPDFSGWVTKANLTCTDGRTIAESAFAHQDGAVVPLVYQHNHTDIEQVLGKVQLTKKPEGVWGDAFFNGSPKAQHAKATVQSGDISKLSVWAKDLDERSDMQARKLMVHDGVIQEVSLVLQGANPGAIITNVMAHSVDGVMLDPEEDLLVVSGEITHSAVTEEKPVEAPPVQTDPPAQDPPADAPAEGDKSVADVLATLSDEQQTAVNQFIEDLVPELVTEALTEEPNLQHSALDSSQKGNDMSRNIFDRNKATDTGLPELKHSDAASVLALAKGPNGEGGSMAHGSLRELVRSDKGKELMHADTYGVDNLEILFPDAQALMNTPRFVDRRQDWVKTFMAGTSHTPFSRVKTLYADITADEARARGYIKGNQKVDEVFPVFKRETGPAWIYKRQRLDRQDIIDIVDFDVVAWMKVEMRGKLDEEIARAAMFGDGRPTMVNGELNKDKISEPTGTSGNGIRSIVNDDPLYTTTFDVQLAADATGEAWNALLDGITEAGEFYLGSGNKTAFVTYRAATKLLTIRDDFGHRIYRNLSEIAGDMDVSQIVRVPTELFPEDVLAIVLDLSDYNFGTNRGGEITLFDDFDIDFNQFIYLMETYLSGALVVPYAAQIFRRVDTAQTVVTPTRPAIADNVVTIPAGTDVVYTNSATDEVLAAGDTVTLTADNTPLTIVATPAEGKDFEGNQVKTYNYTFKA